MMINQIKETCIYFHDLELAKEFYHAKLGLPSDTLNQSISSSER